MTTIAYSISEVKKISIADYLESIGAKVRGFRSNAPWHKNGGDNTQAISFEPNKNIWHDFVEGGGGSVIDLCMLAEGLSFSNAVRALGSRFNIEAKGTKLALKRRPKPKVAPNWVVVSLCILRADKPEELYAEKSLLTEADRFWTRRVAELLTGELKGASLEDALALAIRLYHAGEKNKENSKGVRK